MSYTVTMTSPAHRMFRRLPPDVRQHLVAQAQQLATKPDLGEQLQGMFRAFRSLHIKYRNTHYRIVYEVNNQLDEVIVRAVGTRENFYKGLYQMRLKPLAS